MKLLVLCLLIFSHASMASDLEKTSVERHLETRRVTGYLRESGTSRPIAAAAIHLLPIKLKAVTNSEGLFVFDTVPFGNFSYVVQLPDHLKAEGIVDINSNTTDLKVYLEKKSYSVFETTVVGKGHRDDSRKTLQAQTIAVLPGAGGDPVKAVQNLPGVNRVGGFSSQIVIQGSAPQDTKYLLDEHEVPNVFHFGGLTSVIMPEAVGQIDYYSAGYGAFYGRALGGQIGLMSRDPERDLWKSLLFADTAKAGAMIEGPVTKQSSFLMGGRYSYIGEVLKSVLKDNKEFDLTVVPTFYDVTSTYSFKNDQDHFKVLGLYSHDELGFLFKEPVRTDPAIRGSFSNQTDFYRVIPQWKKRISESLKSDLSFGFGQDWVNVDVGEQYFRLSSYSLTVRGEVEKTFEVASPLKTWKSRWGFDNKYQHSKVSLRLPPFFTDGGVNNPISSAETTEADIFSKYSHLGSYWINDIKIQNWNIAPELRGDYFSQTKQLLFSPRFHLKYFSSDFLHQYFSVGRYYQAPQPQESSAEYGNPQVKAPHAWHFSLGQNIDFRKGSMDGVEWDSKLFLKTFSDLVITSAKTIERNGELVSEKFSNDGRGRAYGIENLLKVTLNPWLFWLSYTYSKSTRWQPARDELPYQYDQTHNINLIGSIDLPSNWKISSRMRYVSGNPSTPVVGATYDSDNDVFVPIRGPIYSERLDSFFQTDLRVDKKWIYDTAILWVYLDIQNVTNKKNSEAIRYSYDYQKKADITGLPVFPTLGVRGEF